MPVGPLTHRAALKYPSVMVHH